jgi:hypothetical protein
VFRRDTESWSGDFGGVGGEPAGCDRPPEPGSANRESLRGTRSVGEGENTGKNKNAERGDSRRGHTRLVREAGLHLIGVFIIAVSVCELRNRR